MSLGRATAVGAYKHFLLSAGSRRCTGIALIAKISECSHQTLHLCNGKMLVRSLNTLSRQPINYAKEHLDKNILIYRNDGFQFFRMVGIFALAQLGFWSYLTYSAFTSMTDSRNFELLKYGQEGAPSEIKNWKSLSGIRMKLHSGTWRYAITAMCIVVGGAIFSGAWIYSRKCIHRIVLRKGGARVTISTFGFFGQLWSFTTPISNISCRYSRHGVRMQLPIRVKGHRFFYLLDKEGKLYNAPLFDQTVGMRRGCFDTVYAVNWTRLCFLHITGHSKQQHERLIE